MGWFGKKKKTEDSAGTGASRSTEQFTALVQKAETLLKQKGLGDQIARVACVIDVSASMGGLFRRGTVQNVVERALALGVNFDDNEAVDMFTFGVLAHDLGELGKNDFSGYVRKAKMAKNLEGGTNYAPIIRMVTQKYASEPGDPAYVMFVTDGDCHDKMEATQAIIEAARHGLFFQFIGIGGASFDFLERLDNMEGRVVDNANFFEVNDIASIDDTELYERMLVEFPDWLNKALELKII